MEYIKIFDGHAWVFSFDNGYGLSVVCHEYSYGGRSGLFEAALLHDGQLCYRHEGWPDVRGWLTFAEVSRYAENVKLYKPLLTCKHTHAMSEVTS